VAYVGVCMVTVLWIEQFAVVDDVLVVEKRLMETLFRV
jgi:hypothetical protein